VNAYIDSSILLRKLLHQPHSLREWSGIRSAVASALAEIECLRTLDRFRLRSGAPVDEWARHRETVFALLRAIRIVLPTQAILDRATQALPAPLGTLDAIHLATALVWRESRGEDLVFATHDAALGLAARASGFAVIGL
jgi:predicted nucleic acid-binding protein